MAKNELNEDLLTGGSLGKKDSKEAKKAEKLKKQKEKNAAKKSEIKSKIDVLKIQKESETDEKKVAQLDAQIKKLVDKYNSVGSSNGVSVAPRTAKIIKSVICIVVVIALLAAYVSTGMVRKGFVSYLNIPGKILTCVVVTDGENKQNIKVGTYNYYYSTTYNSLKNQQSQYQQYQEQYGIELDNTGLMDLDFTEKLSKQIYTDPDTNEKSTWAEHLDELVLESIKTTYMYYLEAVENNDGKEPEITEEQQTELDETVKEYRETAESYNYTLSGYLTKAMGHGVNEKLFITECTRQYIAQNYQESLSDGSNAENFTADEIEAYKDENKDSFKTVDIMLFECDNEDDAKEFKSQINSDGSNFAALASKYSSDDFYKKAYKDPAYSTIIGATKQDLQNRDYAIALGEEHKDEEEGEGHEHKYPGLDWLFSSKRQAGDTYQYSTSVVYVIKPAAITDRKTVNVRHILITPDKDLEATQQTTATAEKWEAAEKEAKKILKEWKSGDKTENSFAALAKENSADGSASNGGLYENIVTCQMVDSFSAWCFDDARKTGDTAIVQTDYGYHIMYFVGHNDQAVWQYSAQQTLAQQDGTTKIEKLEDSYKATTKWFGTRYTIRDVDIAS